MRGIGIDFGAANSLLATFDGKEIDVKLADGQAHSSIVWYKKRRQPRVGAEAREAYMTQLGDPESVFIKSVKRRLATDDTVTLATRTISSEIATEVTLSFLLEDAKISPEPEDRFVIAIPKSLTPAQREEIRKAAETAGFSAQFLIPEAFAALVGYLGRESEEYVDQRKVAVVDWGAGFVDVTLMVIKDGWIAEVASCTLDDIGGDDIDILLAKEALRRFMDGNELKLDAIEEAMPNLDPLEALLGVAEEAKIALSSEEKAKIKKADFCTIGKRSYDLDEDFTRDELEELIRPLVDRALMKTENLMSSVDMKPADIDFCLLVGESSQIPLIAQEFESLMGKRRLVTPPSQSTLVAEGASLIAYRKWLPRLGSNVGILLANGTGHLLVMPGMVMLPEDEPRKPAQFVCVDPREGVARTVVRARPVFLPGSEEEKEQGKETAVVEHAVEMDVDCTKAYRVYNLPRLVVETEFDGNQVFHLRVYSHESDSETALDLESTALATALLTKDELDEDEKLAFLDNIRRSAASALWNAPSKDADASNIMPIKAGRRQVWASIPVDLLIELEPQIKDVRLMENYLTEKQIEDYLAMLPPIEIDDSENDEAKSDVESNNDQDDEPGNE